MRESEQKDRSERPGPDPERLKIERDWEEAVREALRKGKPPPEKPEPKRRRGK